MSKEKHPGPGELPGAEEIGQKSGAELASELAESEKKVEEEIQENKKKMREAFAELGEAIRYLDELTREGEIADTHNLGGLHRNLRARYDELLDEIGSGVKKKKGTLPRQESITSKDPEQLAKEVYEDLDEFERRQAELLREKREITSTLNYIEHFQADGSLDDRSTVADLYQLLDDKYEKIPVRNEADE